MRPNLALLPERKAFPKRGPHAFALQVDGGEFIPAMLDAIAGAKDRVFLEMYLFVSGSAAERFIAALTGAARRGVAVYLLIDDFGSRGLSREDRERLVAAGVHMALYNPLGLGRWRVSLLRNHRKLLAVDGAVAFVGGMGITDDFDPESRRDGQHWHEVMLQLRGPCVADWEILFAHCWRQWSMQPIALPTPPPKVVPGAADGQVVGHIRAGGRPVMRSVLTAIRKARQRVWIATAYFVPTVRLRRALRRAARRGVDVRLLLAGPRNDHPSVWHAGRRFYGRLLRGGVRIFEYQPRFLHAKAVLCDDWSSIGSSNLDHWTLRWNLEANQTVIDPAFAGKLAELFTVDFEHSEEWTDTAWRNRGLWLRLMERVAGGLDDYLVQWSYRRALRQPPPQRS
ncbi:phospholipase D-like domain-containing protein [Thioalkalivibrio sp.]|uniref:phospholipase D-like domain-containing protein n=1 Tax=Thioalkalivibrio sp. TaxID=2093813 RepID=UPI0025D29C40|nr:phospholipase D-like domain-containing protein [Thioalkalivibrio sp.]